MKIGHRILGAIVLPSLALFLFAQGARAQSQFATLTGLVTDPSGHSVAGVGITVTNQRTGVQSKTVTNAAGNYIVQSLIPGIYHLSTSKAGFSSATKTDIRLNLGQTARIDVALQLGRVSQQVTVKASGVLLQTESASVGAVIPESGVVNLPLNGRNYVQLATLVPGVTAARYGGINGSQDGMPFNNLDINGTRETATTYLIDGADVMNQYQSGTEFTPAPDAIQEFRVETNNMSAQYGNGGSIVSVALKSGTDSFHGDVYEFLRNNAMDARNYFALTTPALKQNQFGFTLGGPILKRKLFFFVDYQGTRVRQDATYNTPVATSAEQGGDFSGLPPIVDPYTKQPLTNNTIPSGDISSFAKYFLPFLPTPNTSSGTYDVSLPKTSNLDQFDIRIDDQLREADLLTFTFSHQFGNSYTPGPFPLNGGASASSLGTFTNFGWTHIFSPTLVNHAHFAYASEDGTEGGQGIGGVNQTVQSGIGGFEQTSKDYPGPPNLSISGYGGINGYFFRPINDPSHNFNISDMLTKVVGRHTILIGGDARWAVGYGENCAYCRGGFNFTGTYTGNAFADFLYGIPFNGYRSFPENQYAAFQQNQDLFIQDTWKATHNLTLVGGLRWDVIHPNTYLHNAFASVNSVTNQITVASNSQGQINTTAQQVTAIILPYFQSLIVPSSNAGLPNSLVYTDWHGFAPRIGLAYQLSPTAVLRAGYGIFYPLPNLSSIVAAGLLNAPFFAAQTSNFNTTPVPTVTVANMFPDTSAGNYELGPLSFYQIDPNEPNQKIQEYNVTFQKSIGQVLSLQAAYVGTKGSDLMFTQLVNIPTPGPGAIQARRPNPFWAAGSYISRIGVANYNSLQLAAETQSWRGLFFRAAFTWGKTLDNLSSDGSPTSYMQDPSNIDAEYGISDYNVAKNFSFASTYQLPFFQHANGLLKATLGGWATSNIITFQTGLPFAPTVATDSANTGTSMRPNQIGDGRLSHPTIKKWFNAAAFTVPAPYTYGDSRRNMLTGPGIKNWDFALFKNFPLSFLSQAAHLQFRGEFFNFTNTPHFGLPNTNIQSSTVGEIFSAGAPRETQVSLKVIF